MLHRPGLLNWVPILAPRLCFAGLQKTEVRLVIGIYTSHDFDIGGKFTPFVRAGQIAIPGITELVVSPGPLLFSRADVMIGDVHNAGLCSVIVTTEEIFLTAQAHV
jgi:hypothetical protein